MDRKTWAFALVGVAARLRVEDWRITEARIVLVGVASIPWPRRRQRATWSATRLARACSRAATAVLVGAEPLRHNRDKLPLARALETFMCDEPGAQ